MTHKIKHFSSKFTILNLLITSIALGSAFFLPLFLFDENSYIETLEIIALVIGVFFCFKEYKKNYAFSDFFLTCGLFIIILIGREISWGRTFFTNETGHIIESKNWAFHTQAHIALAIYIISLLYHAIKTKFFQNCIILLKKAPIMTFDFALMIILVFLSSIFESHYSLILPKHLYPVHVALEEMGEIALYLVGSSIIFSYGHYNLLHNIKSAKEKSVTA